MLTIMRSGASCPGSIMIGLSQRDVDATNAALARNTGGLMLSGKRSVCWVLADVYRGIPGCSPG
jgi:hypothetical protein